MEEVSDEAVAAGSSVAATTALARVSVDKGRETVERTFGGQGECCICLGDMHRRAVKHLPCGHTHHYGCLKRWFATKRNCPQCRWAASPRAADESLDEMLRLDEFLASTALTTLFFMQTDPFAEGT